MNMHAGTLIRTARTDAGLTLRGLAESAQTSHSTLSAYETGAKTPSVATLNRIVRAAGFELDTSLRRRHRNDGQLTKGDELVAVLQLAEAFPANHAPTMDMPIFGRS